MKLFSGWSLLCTILGICSFGVMRINGTYPELMVFLVILCLLIAILLSFTAIFRKEAGVVKLFAVLAPFVFLFFISWYEPFQIVRMLVWMKHIG